MVFKVPACPDLATNLRQILIPTTYDSLELLPPSSQNLKFGIQILPVQKGGFLETSWPKHREDRS